MAAFAPEAVRLIREAEQHTGLKLDMEYTRAGHVRVVNRRSACPIRGEDGLPLLLPATPSDVRAWDNVRARFKRLGLIEKEPPKQTLDSIRNELSLKNEHRRITNEITAMKKRLPKLMRRLDQIESTLADQHAEGRIAA